MAKYVLFILFLFLGKIYLLVFFSLLSKNEGKRLNMANCCNTNGNICQDETCKIDAVITMDAKGQIVLPKDLREKANMKTNDKIAIIACEKNGETCCIMMIKTEKLVDAVTKTLAPLLTSITTPTTNITTTK